MLEISMNQISKGLLMYGIVIVILYMGTKLHVSWFDISELLTKKKFFLRCLFCFVLNIIVLLIIIISEIVKDQNDVIYSSAINVGLILVGFYRILVVSIIVQRYRCMRHSKLIMIPMLSIVVFNYFFNVLDGPVLLIIILIIGMLPDKNTLTKEQ